MRLIADGLVDREGVDGLARRVGYTPRHLGRLLTQELGAGPLALARVAQGGPVRVPHPGLVGSHWNPSAVLPGNPGLTPDDAVAAILGSA